MSTNQYAQEPVDTSVYLKIEPNSEVRIRVASPFINFWESFQNAKPTERFAWVVLQRDKGTKVKAFKVSAPLYSQVRKLAMTADWGDPIGYDLIIRREGEAFDTVYTVTPCPKAPITEAEQKLIADAKIDLAELYKKNMVDKPANATVDEHDPFANE